MRWPVNSNFTGRAARRPSPTPPPDESSRCACGGKCTPIVVQHFEVWRADGGVDVVVRDVTDPERPGPWTLFETERTWCPS